MKVGVGLCVALVWLLVVAGVMGPQASGSIILGIWLVSVCSVGLIVLLASERAPEEPMMPHEVADRLGALADAERIPFKGKVSTLTHQERQEFKRRLYLVSQKERGRANVAQFRHPKGAA